MAVIDLSQARLTTLAVHRVGNKVKNQGVLASNALFPLDDEVMVDTLEDFFLKPFRAEEFFKFTHPSDLAMNEVCTYCKRLFTESREVFLETSVHLLNHLYDQAMHPQIKSGELFVAHFRECQVEGVTLEAIGIFKTEHKDLFLRITDTDDTLQLVAEQGVNVRRLDKGCLVFNTFEDDGYSVMMVDKDSEDSQYWREDFLRVTRIQDNSFQTQGFLSMTKEFVQDVFSREQDKKEQMVFMNKAIDYFQQREAFDLEEFKNEVIEQPEFKEQFEDYRQQAEASFGIQPEEGFAISKYAVRQMKRQVKNLIRLDSDVEIRFTGKNLEDSSEMVERGFDSSRGMLFYKIYFREELP